MYGRYEKNNITQPHSRLKQMCIVFVALFTLAVFLCGCNEEDEKHGFDDKTILNDMEAQNSYLIKAALIGDSRLVKRILDASEMSVNDPLKVASEDQILKRLFVFENKWTALHAACHGITPGMFSGASSFVDIDSDYYQVVEALVQKGANMDAADGNGMTPLYYAIYCINSHNREEYRKIARYLIEQGAQVKMHTCNSGDGTWRVTALHLAVSEEKLVKLLLQHGADPNFSDSSGATPLHWACRGGYAASVKLLLTAGSDPSSKRQESSNEPLLSKPQSAFEIWAREPDAKGYEEVIRKMLATGANVNEVFSDGSSLIHRAVSMNNKRLVKLAIDSGADVNYKDGTGHTPLSLAELYGESDICEVLINSGSDLTIKEKDANADENPFVPAPLNPQEALK